MAKTECGKEEHTARVLLVDGSYRTSTPDRPAPFSDSFLLKQISRNEFVAQGSNGREWAYALIVRADMYYLFAFNRTGQNCTSLLPEERHRLHIIVRDDICYVSSLNDLIRLLRFLRRKFPYPTSAFNVREVVR